ncbi:hypothetical protein B0J12DRAFT_446552 [Macrophomina phaseolina]|uniref:Uncharacterized protein n=1 Tax=Macrophomina phaseolina TaxID=35725 RepID=A0ABQ8FT88_9PEZI|nr:hypothetical protein B0J12DRAFT_446552 [Macrophomina phaseolina]
MQEYCMSFPSWRIMHSTGQNAAAVRRRPGQEAACKELCISGIVPWIEMIKVRDGKTGLGRQRLGQRGALGSHIRVIQLQRLAVDSSSGSGSGSGSAERASQRARLALPHVTAQPAGGTTGRFWTGRSIFFHWPCQDRRASVESGCGGRRCLGLGAVTHSGSHTENPLPHTTARRRSSKTNTTHASHRLPTPLPSLRTAPAIHVPEAAFDLSRPRRVDTSQSLTDADPLRTRCDSSRPQRPLVSHAGGHTCPCEPSSCPAVASHADRALVVRLPESMRQEDLLRFLSKPAKPR